MKPSSPPTHTLGQQAVYPGNGALALTLLEAERFDVVLMDVQMPEMDLLPETLFFASGTPVAGTLRGMPVRASPACSINGASLRCALPMSSPLLATLVWSISSACGGAASPGFDPLSNPAQPTLSAQEFPTAAACSACHVQQYKEWQTSQHAQAMSNPVYQALVALERQDVPGDRFCFQCHSPIGTRSWDIGAAFSFAAMTPITAEGVTCTTCHRISAVTRPYDSGVVLDQSDVAYGPLASPVGAPHGTHDLALVTQSLLCGACHDVFSPQSGLWLETPFQEWSQADRQQSGAIPTCQDCHMPLSQGPAAQGGPMRTLHSHRFVGADVPLIAVNPSDPQQQATAAALLALLGQAGSISLSRPPDQISPGDELTLDLTVRNRTQGHRLPTGSTFSREVWVALRVTDSAGTVLYQTGQPVPGEEDPAAPAIEPCEADSAGARVVGQVIAFGGKLIDAQGQPTRFPWRAAAFDNSAPIPSLGQRQFTVPVQTRLTDAFPLQVSAALCLRPFSRALLDSLGLARLRDQIKSMVINQAELTVAAGPGAFGSKLPESGRDRPPGHHRRVPPRRAVDRPERRIGPSRSSWAASQ